MEYASAIVRARVSQLLTYTAPCLGKVVHFKKMFSLTEGLMQISRSKMDDLPNADFGGNVRRK